MKAAIWTRYGPPEVLEIMEVPVPIPRHNEVLIRIHASTVTAGDCEMRRFDLPAWIWLPLRLYMGIRKPRIKILGQELAGEIEATGKEVTRFKKGDRVFAPTTMRLGAHAEFVCLPANFAITLTPAGIGDEEAAAIPTGGLNALHFVRKAGIQAGEKVLVNGAGGCIGTFAVQMAKALGAEVTCVDSAAKLDTLRSLGADHVIDYEREDFTQNGEHYDVIIDVVCKTPVSRCMRSLRPKGRYVAGNPGPGTLLHGLWTALGNGKKVINALAPYQPRDLDHLAGLVERGTIRPVLDKRFPLEQIVEAHRYVESGRKTGSVVITI